MDAHKLTSSGVDWLTATAYRTRKHESFYALGKHLLEIEAGHGNDINNWKAHGYHGLRSAGVRVGLRYDSFIVQLSDDAAHDHWREVSDAATNITRLDLETTFEFDRPQRGYIRHNFKLAKQHKSGRGRRRNLGIIENTIKGDTLYAGARTSDVFARYYDKGMEARVAPKGKLFRNEVEFKRDMASHILSELREATDANARAHGIVSRHFERLGLETPAYSGDNRESARARLTSDNSRRMRWLASSVRPTVETLIKSGKLSEVLDALGLASMVQPLAIDGHTDEGEYEDA